MTNLLLGILILEIALCKEAIINEIKNNGKD